MEIPKRQKKETMPVDYGRDKWKNRHYVAAKLDKETHCRLIEFCTKKSLSKNAGIKYLLENHPLLS